DVAQRRRQQPLLERQVRGGGGAEIPGLRAQGFEVAAGLRAALDDLDRLGGQTAQDLVARKDRGPRVARRERFPHRSHLPTSLSKSVILATPAERRKAGIAAFASKPVAQRMCRREHRFSIWDVRISTETSLPARRPPDSRPTAVRRMMPACAG